MISTSVLTVRQFDRSHHPIYRIVYRMNASADLWDSNIATDLHESLGQRQPPTPRPVKKDRPVFAIIALTQVLSCRRGDANDGRDNDGGSRFETAEADHV